MNAIKTKVGATKKRRANVVLPTLIFHHKHLSHETSVRNFDVGQPRK